jgi:hypothetical protein
VGGLGLAFETWVFRSTQSLEVAEMFRLNEAERRDLAYHQTSLDSRG